MTKSQVFLLYPQSGKSYFTHLCQKFIKWPTEEEREQVERGFNKYALMNVIGCIDGSHIPIEKPIEHANDYFDREKFYSVVSSQIKYTLQLYKYCIHVGIARDLNLLFTDVDVRWPGSVHDASHLRFLSFG